ncbi:MAG: polyphosphate polymerase domain-containing protein [Alphaproteobacteria bacterium]|nr:polyphosphate polymerase domain-containing protein [Alphaproteobacteria bacterium]
MSTTEHIKSGIWRVEDKYALSPAEFEHLKYQFAAVLPMDRGQSYSVSSLYFDDYFDSFLQDAVNGQPVREKFRVRIYDDSLSVIKLEHKKKQYSRICKDFEYLNEDELKRLVAGQMITKNDGVSALFNAALLTRHLKPKIVARYKRTAFVYEGGKVRITFDENLEASQDVLSFGSDTLKYDFAQDAFRVVEVKYTQFLPNFIANLLDCGNMWQSANSKYRICRELCNV